MHVLLHQFQLNKVQFRKIIFETYYPLNHIENLIRKEIKAEVDLQYLEEFAHVKHMLSVEGIAILHHSIGNKITSANCTPIVRFFGFESGKSLLNDYVKWLVPITRLQELDSSVKIRNKIKLIEGVACILERNYPQEHEKLCNYCEILKEKLADEF